MRLLPMINQTCCRCKGWLFQVLLNTIADNTQLNKIADADTHPEILFAFPGRQQLTTKASKGSNTVANAKNRVKESSYGRYVCNYVFFSYLSLRAIA